MYKMRKICEGWIYANKGVIMIIPKKVNTYDIAVQIIKEECHSCSKQDTCTRVCDKVMAKYKKEINDGRFNQKFT